MSGSQAITPLAPRAQHRATAAQAVSKTRINPISYSRAMLPGAASQESRFLNSFEATLAPGSRAIAVGRARVGIYLLVKFALRKTGRRKVVMSPFTIPDVANMVTLAGGECVFFDNEPNSTRASLDDLKRCVDAETACALITHYHVNETRLAEITALSRASGAFLFDDCALALGGSIDGKTIGALTDASVFSFSAFKLLNYFWGGLVSTTDPEIAAFVDAETSAWPRLTAMAYASQAARCFRYDIATRPPFYGPVVFPMLRKKAIATNQMQSVEWQRIENTDLDATLTSRPHFSAFREWNRKMKLADAWLRHRREIASVYLEHLSDFTVSAPVTGPDLAGGCFASFLVHSPNRPREDVRRDLMTAGLDVGANLYPNVHRHPRYEACAGATPNVSHLVDTGLFLPTHLGVSRDYARVLATRLVAALKG